MDKVKILFVCLGNICRSPSAEAVMKALVEKDGLSDLVEIDSAGILGVHAGEPANSTMMKHASKRGYQLTSISRQITAQDFFDFDMIIGMDNQNIIDLNGVCPNDNLRSKISKMTDYSSNSLGEVPDPYYGGDNGFILVLDILEDACSGLLEHVKTK